MSIFRELDELGQTASVIIIFFILISVIYLLWNLSPKVMGLLMIIGGGIIIFFAGFSMKAHQFKPFFNIINIIGFAFVIVGLILLLFV